MIFSLTRSPPSVKQDRIHHPSVSSTYRATYSGENMAPSRSTPRMMQMTRAAFQAVVSLNEQATDPKSHTLVRITYTLSSPVLSPANSDGRPSLTLPHIGDHTRPCRPDRTLKIESAIAERLLLSCASTVSLFRDSM